MLGIKIGNYKITSMIGEGGMGAVYRAVHESLGRSAAVKVLLPEISSSRDMVARFFNEARAAASIQHPGIVEAYDFGFLPDGRAYIIMEFLEGETLASRLQRVQRMPHLRGLQIVRSVARALHAAHERGIVHRDIKPDNIFLVPDPEMPTGERVKLLDFGIAKLDGEGPEFRLTQTGAVMGTPTYMAPEQCRGAGSVDRRADLYALGCILYEILCGRPPFIAEGAGDIIAHHLYFQPELLRSHDPSISASLEALVLTLLQKDPAHRPATALALVEAIDRQDPNAAVASMKLEALRMTDSTSALSSARRTTLKGAIATIQVSTVSPSWSRVALKGIGAIAITAAIIVTVVRVSADEPVEEPSSIEGPVVAASVPDLVEARAVMPPTTLVDAVTSAPSSAPDPISEEGRQPAKPAALAMSSPSAPVAAGPAASAKGISVKAPLVTPMVTRVAPPPASVATRTGPPPEAVAPLTASPTPVPSVAPTAPLPSATIESVQEKPSPIGPEASTVVSLYREIGQSLKRLDGTRGTEATHDLWPRFRLIRILEVTRTREGLGQAYDTLRALEREIAQRSQ